MPLIGTPLSMDAERVPDPPPAAARSAPTATRSSREAGYPAERIAALRSAGVVA